MTTRKRTNAEEADLAQDLPAEEVSMSYIFSPDEPVQSLGSRKARRRPVGITILALLNFIGVGIYVLVLLSTLATPQAPPPVIAPSTGPEGVDGLVGELVDVDALLRDIEESQASRRAMSLFYTLLISLPLALAVGIGLWRLRPWGRKLALFAYGGGFVLTLLMSYSSPLVGSTIISLIISAVAFLYLLRPDVRVAFYA